MSKRWKPRMAILVGAIFGFSLFSVVPAQAQTCPPLVLVPLADFQLSFPKDGPFSATVGDRFVYSIEVENHGPCGDESTLEDELPGNVRFVSASHGGTYSSAGHKVTWNLAELAAGDSRTVSVTVRARDPGPAINSASVEPKNANDPIPVNNNTGTLTNISAEEPPAPENGGGGGLDGFEDDFGGFGDGFGNFGTGFGTTTPLGGVDTGAGGTARSNSAVPQIALGSLLAIGFLLLALRRFRRA